MMTDSGLANQTGEARPYLVSYSITLRRFRGEMSRLQQPAAGFGWPVSGKAYRCGSSDSGSIGRPMGGPAGGQVKES